MRRFLSSAFLFFSIALTYAQAPTFEEVISLQSVGSPRVSPDGQHVVFTRSSTDWENNRFDTEIWLAKNGEDPLLLTHTKEGSSRSPRWSPDGRWIAFLASRDEETQILLIRANGGEAYGLTETSGGVSSFEWSPDGKQIVFAQRRKREEEKQEETYGRFGVEDEEYECNELWVIDVNPDSFYESLLPAQLEDSIYLEERKPKKIISGDFHVGGYLWSPTGAFIAYNRQPDPLPNSFFHADVYLYDVANDTSRVLVNNLSADGLLAWSPDGEQIAFRSSVDDSVSNYYQNSRQFIIGRNGNGEVEVGLDVDEDLNGFEWTAAGLTATAWQKTRRIFYQIDSETGASREIATPVENLYSYSFSKDGDRIAFSARNDQDLTEIYIANYPFAQTKQITQMGDQLANWHTGSSDVVSWESMDRETIEGVLHKPSDFDPARKYPLMVVIHGGPTGISTPQPVPAYVYPQLQWMAKGALILRPNYRGSAGYGARFRALNVRNLGVGDAWDVESGVQNLIDKGIVHSDSVAAMGWSQGGYISAFLSTNSDRFKAISVGAGISNWMTYYVNTDIHPFTRQYLQATPWSDKAVYDKTSPMTNINQAQTPTLIQHGEFDRRVPIPNAYELYQGLQDVGVDTKLIVYKGFGHGITKPKERLAAIWHNWQWFAKHLWGEEVEMPE